jgi:hypothetical protein
MYYNIKYNLQILHKNKLRKQAENDFEERLEKSEKEFSIEQNPD